MLILYQRKRIKITEENPNRSSNWKKLKRPQEQEDNSIIIGEGCRHVVGKTQKHAFSST